MPNPLPTRGALDLGPTLTNVRAPIANELSAVHVESMKDWIIDLATEIGNPDGSTGGSLWEGIATAGGFAYVAVTADATLPSNNAIVDVDTSGLTAPDTLELTLPAAVAGRLYIVRKISGAANETITLVRAASEQIDGAAASRLLPGSDNLVDITGHSTPNEVWAVYCDGTNWRTFNAAPETRAVWGKSGPPGGSVDTVSVYDYIPGSTWHDGSTVPGHLWIQTGVDAGDAKWRRIDAPGLLFELDTTSTAQIETTTEVQGKHMPGGSAFAGTITPVANSNATWDSATKLLKLNTSAGMSGFGLRRVLTGDLPAAGFILDVGIGDLDPAALNTSFVVALYEQRTGTEGRGIGIGIREGYAQLDVIGFADDGIDSPAINTSPLTISSAESWGAALGSFDRGPSRMILEFRKVDTSSPERWTLRATLIGVTGNVTSQTYSGIAYPATGWSTSLDLAGASMTRIGIGAWCTSAEGSFGAFSHLRVYELGSAIPT